MASVSEQELVAALFLLRDALERDKKLAAQGITLEAIFAKVNATHGAVDTVTREVIAQGMRLDRYGKKLREIKTLINQEESLDDTGSWRIDEARRAMEVAELQKRVHEAELAAKEEDKESRESVRWWSRQRALWLGIVMTALFAALCSGCVGYAMWVMTHAK